LFKNGEGLILSRDTIPSSRAWGGMESGLKIYNITEPKEVIFFETGNPLEPEGRGETIIKESRPSRLIPDNDPNGISDRIKFFTPGIIKKIKISLDITHTYVQDLRIQIASPSGDIITLVDREGGSGHDIRTSFDSGQVLSSLKDKTFAGAWELQVIDLAQRDIGKLNWWKMEIDYLK